ncbi:MAG TPA: hypothetical protein VFB82_14925 [Blastocatellia bacterium]|jgi:hypothetical protein|nr:hypothetical protein [Blastocatellia bacterium]
MKLLIRFLLLTMLAGSAQGARLTEKLPLDKEFKIKVGQEVTVKKLIIKFNAVHNESRCPTGVQCIWEGNAAIAVQVSRKNKKPVQATLNTNTGVPPSAMKYKGFTIRLVKLSPHPQVNQTINEKDYEATLIVTSE